jgi:hypothetical protein
MCKLNSTEANYKVSTGTEEEKIHLQRKYKKQDNINLNFNTPKHKNFNILDSVTCTL